MPGPINAPSDGSCGYVAFYQGKRLEVYADTSFQAQQRAAAHWKVKERKRYEVSVILAEKNGETVTHIPTE